MRDPFQTIAKGQKGLGVWLKRQSACLASVRGRRKKKKRLTKRH
jgi:hypothetical protein